MQVLSYFLELVFLKTVILMTFLSLDINEHAACMDVLALFWPGFLRSLSHHMLNCQLM